MAVAVAVVAGATAGNPRRLGVRALPHAIDNVNARGNRPCLRLPKLGVRVQPGCWSSGVLPNTMRGGESVP